MLPHWETPRRRTDDGLNRPPPDPIRIAGEVIEYLTSRRTLITGAAVVVIVVTTVTVISFWPEPVERAEMDYLTLQNTVIRGSVESITISGREVHGTFHGTVPAAHGEVVGISEPVPSNVSVDDIYEANAFEATVPEDSRESFIDLAERREVDVTIE